MPTLLQLALLLVLIASPRLLPLMLLPPLPVLPMGPLLFQAVLVNRNHCRLMSPVINAGAVTADYNRCRL
jgi:hypothetical protein